MQGYDLVPDGRSHELEEAFDVMDAVRDGFQLSRVLLVAEERLVRHADDDLVRRNRARHGQQDLVPHVQVIERASERDDCVTLSRSRRR